MKKITMKKLMVGFGLTLLSGLATAQNGLENIIVETYYIADASDAAFSTNNGFGTLPVNSKTYRVFVDMLPGYRFEAAYGDVGKALSITTSTTFFNNEDRGAITPNGINTQYLNDNSVALDSWLSVGAAGNGHIGVLKSEDNGVSNVVMPNSNCLQNTNANIGILLTQQDGMIDGTPEAVTFVGIPQSPDLDPFNATSQLGSSLTTTNGSIASLNGSYGDSAGTNRVLIGQFTTDGDFCFSLNIQIGLPNGSALYEQYVSANATGNEIYKPFLNYCSNLVSVNNQTTEPVSSVTVYPNPATDIVTIDIHSTSQNNSYKLIDVVGNVIQQSTITNQKSTIDISSLAKGIYFMEINIDGEKSTKKIIK